ncbi:MAG: IclR family transcriptional regulator [Bryobacteraceae bacterium]
MPSSVTVTSVERAFSILEALDASRLGMNVSAISRKLGIPKSTAHVIIGTSVNLGYVVREPNNKTFGLSLKVYALGRENMRSLHLPEVSLAPMKWLAAKAGLTVQLAMLEKNQAIYVQKVDGPGLILFDTFIGKRTTLHCTAVGKVLLAHAPEPIQREFLAKASFARHTRNTITSAAALRGAIEKIRRQGFAVDDQEEELGIRCLAVPVVNPSGAFVAALGLTGTVDQVEAANIPKLVATARRAASRIYAAPGS